MHSAERQSEVAGGRSQHFAFLFNNFYVEISRVVTKKFYNDLHLFFVLVAISCNSISRIMNDHEKASKYKSVSVPIDEDYIFIKLLPLSEIVGLPRTTVRRKVERLIELGYIEHHTRKGYRIVKRTMAETPIINDILSNQYELTVRLATQMTQRKMLERSDGS
jgi:hypothetical protein